MSKKEKKDKKKEESAGTDETEKKVKKEKKEKKDKDKDKEKDEKKEKEHKEGGSKKLDLLKRDKAKNKEKEKANTVASYDFGPTKEGDHIQKDWEERDWIEQVHLDALRLASFLNQFEASTRDRLSKLNDAVLRIEREVDFLEARYVTVQQVQKAQS